MSAFPTVRVGDHAKHELLLEDRHGAGDEDTGSDFAAMAKKITWWQAAEILGFSDRHRRRNQPSPKRVPFAQVEKVLTLYREKYFDLNIRHFHENYASSMRSI